MLDDGACDGEFVGWRRVGGGAFFDEGLEDGILCSRLEPVIRRDCWRGRWTVV